jgi:serine O-acetyltransferase
VWVGRAHPARHDVWEKLELKLEHSNLKFNPFGREEAQRDASSEPLLSSFLYASILAHESFERALAFVLANRLANPTMLPTQLFEIFHSILVSDDDVRCAALADLEACKDRVRSVG